MDKVNTCSYYCHNNYDMLSGRLFVPYTHNWLVLQTLLYKVISHALRRGGKSSPK